MTKPTYEEILQDGCVNWNFRKEGLIYQLSFHGCSEHQPQGIWCYYLIVTEQMFPHKWDTMKAVKGNYGYSAPKFWRNDWFASEITFAAPHNCLCRHQQKEIEGIKVGCDYNHIWHSEMGYSDTFASVKRDAEITVEKFLADNPDYCWRSDFSNKWGKPEEFYIAKNGNKVHNLDVLPDEWLANGWAK